MADERFYETPVADLRRSAPAALRNREPIGDVLEEWFPPSGLVLEIASGTGEHSACFAERFPQLEWQPSDVDERALGSIRAWQAEAALPNLRDPILLDASSLPWPIDKADAVLSINMVHISPWSSALGLIDGAAAILPTRGPLILYGPWISDAFQTAPSNAAFDADLQSRNSEWGLRKVEDFAAAAGERGVRLVDQRQMPANNLMLLFENGT